MTCVIVTPDGLVFTDEENELAERILVETKATLEETVDLIERCRGAAFTPEDVIGHATLYGTSHGEAFRKMKARAAPTIIPAPQPHDRTTPMGMTWGSHDRIEPPPNEGTLHLREPVNKAERRLARDIQKAIEARNTIIGQLARANRVIAKIEVGLRQAGMITGGGS